MALKSHVPLTGGQRWIDTKYHTPWTFGNCIYVSSVVGTQATLVSNASAGFSPESAYTTLDVAVGAAVASNADKIVLLPGHVDTVTAAGGIDLDVAGIHIIGIGEGRLKPRINFTTSTGADIDIDAANITIENVYFDLTGIDALAAPLDINATDFTLRGCEIETGDSGGQATLALLTDANASRLTVERCFFFGSTDAGTATCLRIVGGDGHKILDNIAQGNYTTTLGFIDNNTTPCTNTIVGRNVINNRTASSTKAMVFDASSTGQIFGNQMQILNGSAPITGAAMSWVGANYYSATIATAGTLI